MKYLQKAKTPLGKLFLVLTTTLLTAYVVTVGAFVIYFFVNYGVDYSCTSVDQARDICTRNSLVTNAILGSMIFAGICLPAIIVWIALAVVMTRRKILAKKLCQ
ncbi:MAG: hypothetical protein EOO17_03255 [Chloroflexi bacterium]|nr:MAG: hypothetical protein EOO17_03255 [Chloroflexota bacterium]